MNKEEVTRTEIGSIGEFALIDRITQDFKTYNSGLIAGLGDDAAVIEGQGEDIVLTTDLLVEGIHFDLSYTPLKYLGYKAVAVNLSDVCAMNGIPTQILVSIALSNRFSVEAVEEIYKGIKMACDFYKVDLIGGDTTASVKGLVINITALGKCEKGKHVLRSTAREEDLICVTGDLGAAYMGLQILEREKTVTKGNPMIKADFEEKKYIIERQLKPEARKDIIEFFRQNNIVPTSMIDISDGLSSEIMHLCKKSNLGCVLEEEYIPVAEETYMTAVSFNIDPTLCALSGGEDYELLFTVPAHLNDIIASNPDIKMIGQMLPIEMGVKLKTKGGNFHDIMSLGWDSFKE
jgi:thiamine-monophosphate kinase